jgi:hypothetical protein
MGSYQQLGTRLWDYGAGGHRSSPAGRILLAAAFMAAICLIAILIGAASVQYP